MAGTDAGISIRGDASRLAFDAGQALQLLLIERAVANAENRRLSQETDLTVEFDDVVACIDDTVAREVRARLGIDRDGHFRSRRASA